MKGIYSSPFRVYLVLALLIFVGGYLGSQLPISLYPNSNKPTINVYIPYGPFNAQEFIHNYGGQVENRLQAVSTDEVEVEKVISKYRNSDGVSYQVEFKWGADPKRAMSEIESSINSISAGWPREIRDGVGVNFWSRSSGFIAISFFSEDRSVEQMYKLLEPAFIPKLVNVKDAEKSELWNPNSKEVTLELNPEVMATLKLMPADVEKAIYASLSGHQGGNVVVGEKNLTIQMPRAVDNVDHLKNILVTTAAGKLIALGDIANIDFGNASGKNMIIKTNGAKSLILFASPRTGGNVKKMSDDILAIVDEVMQQMPRDIKYRTLVNPSEFIEASVENVLHEVFLAAGLAVLVLFIFIGSFKNTVTAAIEIPMSMILAFILMKMTGMNLNLISLGGLALAAGMNVDASIVVLENIFRHFKMAKGPFDYAMKLKIVSRAVKEVSLPIVASTISTLVVFIPLAATQDLTNAILGDLAKAVVFSHAFSMLVALLIVPTIRLHLIKKAGPHVQIPTSPIEGLLNKLEGIYEWSLGKFIQSKICRFGSFILIPSILAVLLIQVVPNLKREIVGTPDTDWMILRVSTGGNTQIRQMEEQSDIMEAQLLNEFGKYIKYTFVQIFDANSSMIMARLKDKKDMDTVWKAMEERFQNTPNLFFWVGPWNPAELPLPNPPDMRLIVRGGNLEDRTLYAQELLDQIQNAEAFPRNSTEPTIERIENIVLKPHWQRWPGLQKLGANFSPAQLADMVRVATQGKNLGEIALEGEKYPLLLTYPKDTVSNKEQLESMPIGVAEKIIPLKAIVDIDLEVLKPAPYREQGRDLVVITSRQNKGHDDEIPASLAKVKQVVENFKKSDLSHLQLSSSPSVQFEDAQVEMNQALEQLSWAIAFSVLLILFTLIMQFGSLAHSLIIMVAIPLGIIGGTTSLWLFGSTISLNSVLGIILLNGIAVNNSIILVDFIRSLVAEGMSPVAAAIMASKQRLRPILITSLTTILGMLPVAIGSGEGGKILQPLGIAVTGGLWISMLFTLFMVPLLEVVYFKWTLPAVSEALAAKDLAVERIESKETTTETDEKQYSDSEQVLQ